MKLERASLLAVIACFISLLLLFLLGAWANQQLSAKRAELDALHELRGRLDVLSVAADELLLFAEQPALLAAFDREARDLKERLASLPDTSGKAAQISYHIDRVQRTLAALGRGGDRHIHNMTPPIEPAAGVPLSLDRLTLISTASNRGIAIDQISHALVKERQDHTHDYLGILAATFMLATALFGFVCIATFAYIHRRIAGSLSRIYRSVEQIGDGKTYLRVPAPRDDEVGALAVAINRLLDNQAAAMATIGEQQQQIRQQSELLSVAGDVARVGGWSFLIGEETVVWSDVTAAIHGKPGGYSPTPEEAISFFRDEDQPLIQRAFSDCVEHARPYDLRLQIVDSHGTAHWVRTAGVPVHDEKGDIIGAQGAMQDISARMEVELQLQRAQRLESIGQLTGGIAHDFNNILTVIIGNTELIAEELEDNEKLAPLARMIRDSAERGALLTHQLLAFARRQPLHPQPLSIDDLLMGIQSLLGRAIGEAITLTVESEEDLWPCRLDATQLETAVLNLSINARDAMPAGGTLSVSTVNYRVEPEGYVPVPAMPPGDYVRLTIADTGQGIPEGNMERLFEPFFTTKPSGKGTGLGLPMVYGFVKQSEGFIDVSSRIDEGTVFSLYFPRSEPTAPTRKAAPASETPLRRVKRDYRILMVEDDDLVRRYVEQQLRSLGYRVISASAGEEALAVLRERDDIDLLFTDVVMPGGMSGRDLGVAAAREQPGLRILYTSGYSRDLVTTEGELDDGIDLLRKPYRREDLARRLQAALDEQRG